MSWHPPLDFSWLRDIGWSEWDPIGILSPGETWDHHPAVDEYDVYLLHAADRLHGDWTISDAADYFMWIASEHMGMGPPKDAAARVRAEATATAIKARLDQLSVQKS